MYFNAIDNTIKIEIKQNKEDMEEKITLDEMIKKCEKLEFNSYYKQVKDWLIELKQCKEEKHSNSENIGKNLNPLSLEAAKAGKPVCTRDGRKARIICFDAKGEHPIIALVTDGVQESPYNYTKEGYYHTEGVETMADLMMLPEKKEGWVNVYKNQIYDTPESAEEGHKGITDYIKTIRVKWED